jgi:hypothetical protein
MAGRKYLPPDQVQAIRISTMPYKRLAETFGISEVAIAGIKKRRTYQDVEELPTALPQAEKLIELNAHLFAQDIADAWGVPKGTVQSRIKRYRAALRNPHRGIAVSGKDVDARKRKGGQSSASKNAYYRIHGGNSAQHAISRELVRHKDQHACAACQSAPAKSTGLCVVCESRVTRVKSGAAYGGEPNNLSRTGSGLEADNIITTDTAA